MVGIASFVLIKSSKAVYGQFVLKTNDTIDDNIRDEETSDTIYETIDILINVPDGYQLVSKNNQPYGVKYITKVYEDIVELEYTVPKGYKLVYENGKRIGKKVLEDGKVSYINPSLALPEEASDYEIKMVNGNLVGVKDRIITVPIYIKLNYELPEGYYLDYIDGKFVGVKIIENNDSKVLVKSE